MIRSAFAAILVAFGVSVSHSEPESGIQWLIATPANLFDVGMLRLERTNATLWIPRLSVQVNDRQVTLSPVKGNAVGFDPGTGIISVKAYYIGVLDDGLCLELLNSYREVVVPGGLDPALDQMFFNSYFDHFGYTEAERPENVGAELIEAIRLIIELRDKPTATPGAKAMTCSSDLRGEEVITRHY